MTTATIIGRDVGSRFGGVLRCETCHRIEELTGELAGQYMAHGWPLHCAQTMRWWTQRQIDAGEMT